jgi:RNA polymerase sigma-70 factor, ECF subfamily
VPSDNLHSVGNEALEERIRQALEAGDKHRAATALLEGYGSELLGFLVARLRDRDEASEVFSQFAEDLWSSLDAFRRECSARVWAYMLLRHATSEYLGDVRRRRARQVPLSHAGPLSALEARVRTATLAALKTESKSRFARLRARLAPEEQEILILRVNRKLEWKEIAQVMAHGGGAGDAPLERDAVRLRKRYQLIKDKLRRMAAEEPEA